MLTFAVLSLLLPLTRAAVMKNSLQMPLSPDVAIPALDGLNQTRFAIEDMSATKFRLHHNAAKLLLGEASYLALRKGEIRTREHQVQRFLWRNHLDCGFWSAEDAQDGIESVPKPRIYMSGRRVFDADPERVPRDVIKALEELSARENELRWGASRKIFCGDQQNETAKDDKGPAGDDVKIVGRSSEWKVEVPEEYLQYQIPSSVLEEEMAANRELWKAKDEKDEKDILAGRLSVRDLEMPDLSKCERLDDQVWNEDW